MGWVESGGVRWKIFVYISVGRVIGLDRVLNVMGWVRENGSMDDPASKSREVVPESCFPNKYFSFSSLVEYGTDYDWKPLTVLRSCNPFLGQNGRWTVLLRRLFHYWESSFHT